MPKVALYNIEGETIGEIELADPVFGVEVNGSLLHSAVVRYLANQRQGTSDTKTRSEVAGGGRKPWRQKGSGRARQGSTRAPHWRHGGVAFGPSPRDYRIEMPRKARQAALRSALSAKVTAGDIVVVDGIDFEAPKTREMARVLGNLKARNKALIVTEASLPNVYKSARNLPGVRTAEAGSVSVYEVVNSGKLVITQAAVRSLEGVLA